MGDLYILGDWGTSACRLHLLEDDRLRDGIDGPGIKFCGDPATAFADMTQGWTDIHGHLPALLCGTVGANIGWADAGYTPAPAKLSDVTRAAITIPDTHVTLLPGVRTASNAFGLTDVMRSEEMQVFGWLDAQSETDALLCLPGSHTKWVEVEDSAIENLTTGFVGELFETLSAHSILTRQSGPPELGAEFETGVQIGATHPAFASALFSIRAEAAQNNITLAQARDRLSGLLIGADCAAMLRAWGCTPDAIIGGSAISTAYASALASLGHTVPIADGNDAAIAGLIAARGHL